MTTDIKQPIQPVITIDGKPYFKPNGVVKAFLTAAKLGRPYNLNDAAYAVRAGQLTHEDMVQFTQLLGYSLDSWAELSYVGKEDINRVISQIASGAEEKKEEK